MLRLVADFAECEALERAKARSSEDKLSENDSESEIQVQSEAKSKTADFPQHEVNVSERSAPKR